MSEITFKPWNPTKLTWFITGASSGFALEITRIALSNGHDVIATSRNPNSKPVIKKEIEDLGGRWVPLELDDLNSASTIHNLEKEGTHIDVLFNCAGYAFLGPAEIASEEELRKQMDTNFFGPSRLVRTCVKYMRERRRGMIVNISSGAGVEGRDSMSAYGASKAAMDRLIHVISKEVAPFNVRTLTVSLGTFNTNFSNTLVAPAAALPQDYVGSTAEKVMQTVNNMHGFNPNFGDAKKASQAMYDVIVGQGIGQGREAEKLLPLGRDLYAATKLALDRQTHALEIFGDVCNNVYPDTGEAK